MRDTDFANELLDSLDEHVAVLNAQGEIVAVNEAWKRFARANGGAAKGSAPGTNYLEVCRRADGGEGEDAAEMLHGLRSLLSGERRVFALEYPCHSPSEQRWFVARATRFSYQGQIYVAVMHEDITRRRLADDMLRETEATLRQILEAIPVGLWTLNREGEIVHANPAGVRIWGGIRYVGPEHFGDYKGWWLHSGLPIAAGEWPAARAIQNGETSLDDEIRIECFDGSSKVVLHSAIPLRDAAGGIKGAIVLNQDITARKQAEDQLREANAAIEVVNAELQQALAREQRMARTDELTGVSNRRHFFELGKQLFAIAQRYQTPLAVFMFDIDHFKRINDMFGHQIGDAILRRVAEVSLEQTRGADVLARYGGEEFIVTLPNTTAREALAAVENIRQKIAGCDEVFGGRTVKVTISAGVAEIAPQDDSLERLIQRADHALYAAKRAGRNCSRLWAPV